MRARLLDFALVIGVVASLAVAGARVWDGTRRATPASAPPRRTVVAGAERDTTETLDQMLDRIAETDPFRLDRGAGVPGPQGQAGAGSTPNAPVRAARPALTVSAILGGPPWQAVLGGLPGQAGDVVVRPGTHIGGYSVTGINRDTVIIQASDTTLRLTLRREVP